MPDTKITDLSALTGTDAASSDVAVVVDVSDTSMAASGTDKKITLDELAIAVATKLGVVGRDILWDAAGDVAVGTGANTAERLAVGTSAGQALAADPHATNKLSWQYPISAEERYSGTTGALASTFNRATPTSYGAGLLSGRLTLVRIFLPKGLPVTSIRFFSGNTALATGSNQWFGLFDSSYNKLALTADDTSTAWAATSSKTLAVTGGPYTVTATGWYYLGICVVASTVPNFQGLAVQSAGVPAAAPVMCGNSSTSLTDPASCPSTVAAPTFNNNAMAYAEVV